MVGNLIKNLPASQHLKFILGIRKGLLQSLASLVTLKSFELCFVFIVEFFVNFLFLIFIDLGNNITRKIHNFFQLCHRHPKQNPHPGGYPLQEPDMGYRRSKFNMTHALTSHYTTRYFHATFLADNIFISDSTIFTAIAFIILFWTKDSLIKQTFAF